MASSNNAVKKISELTAGSDKESDILAAVKKRFEANASRAELNQSAQAHRTPVERTPASSTGAPTLQALTQLIANTTEAYTAALFRVDLENRTVELAAAQTLSRELIPGAKFSFGQGLVGWVAENRRRVSASPFELDSTTLMYYAKDQELKSFIAIPIFGTNSTLLGVLAVDSKKSYAFSQMVDKVICDCATVAGQFFELSASAKVSPTVSRSKLEQILEILRSQKDEASLFSAASDLPQDFILRDSLVVLSLAENGNGKGVFYSRASESVENNRLLEIVCRHKKLISAERSVQALRADDLGRTFLSIPVRAFHKEAGSLNLLSRPGESFSIEQISSLEQVSETIGRELERCRLTNLYSRQNLSSRDISGLDWRGFEARGDKAIQAGKHSLIRLLLSERGKIELSFGIDVVTQTFSLISQLLEQVRGTDGLLFELVGGEFLILCATAEKERIISRLQILLSKSESKQLPRELISRLPTLVYFKSADSSSALRTIDQLRKKTLETGDFTTLAEFSLQAKPVLHRVKQPVHSENRANQTAPSKELKQSKKETQQDWNW